jgi:hypothetical protein
VARMAGGMSRPAAGCESGAFDVCRTLGARPAHRWPPAAAPPAACGSGWPAASRPWRTAAARRGPSSWGLQQAGKGPRRVRVWAAGCGQQA